MPLLLLTYFYSLCACLRSCNIVQIHSQLYSKEISYKLKICEVKSTHMGLIDTVQQVHICGCLMMSIQCINTLELVNIFCS